MLKRITIALLCLPLLGLGIIPISGRRDVAAGGIEDDFSGDLSKWTLLTGSPTPTIESGVLRIDGQLVYIYTDEQTSTISQWLLVQYVNHEFNDSDNGGVYFRSTNNASQRAYTVRIEPTNQVLVWRHCAGTSCTDVEESTVTGIDEGDWYGVEVTGTGTDTEVKVWDFGTSAPANRASWGTADDTMTNDPGTAADTGKYVGLYKGSTAEYMDFDNFSAGDI